VVVVVAGTVVVAGAVVVLAGAAGATVVVVCGSAAEVEVDSTESPFEQAAAMIANVKTRNRFRLKNGLLV
jgi:beta-lactam-binding protein with PASTA domain